MSTTLDSRTRASLILAAADPANREARAAFVECYAGLIRDWCRRWDLQEADQANVFQAMLCRLFEMLPTFQYDRSKGQFRGLLRTMTHHAIANLHRERQRHPGICGSGDSEVLGRLHEVPTPDDPAVEDLAQKLARQAERHQQLHEACKRVRDRVEPHTWQAFWLTTVEGQPAVDVAQQLGMKKGAVFVYKCRVTKMIRSEIDGAAACGGRDACPSGSS
jgi:RNA polymerase sigma-70 factor (ECF subfamily)